MDEKHFEAQHNGHDFREGKWGEEVNRDSVNIQRAEDEFQEARRTLSNTSARPATTTTPFSLTLTRSRSRRKIEDEETGESEEDAERKEALNSIIDLEDYLKRTNRQKEETGIVPKRVGVSFRNLSVTGTGGGKIYVKTFQDELFDLFGRNLWHAIRGVLPQKHQDVKAIIQGFNGVVKPKEMLLVLAKPGSGSSTFLRALTNQRRPYTSINGTVHYSGIPFELAKGRYRGEIMFNDEDDVHFPTLTTEQTLRFALKMKTPKTRIPGTSRTAFVETMLNLYASMFGMKHVLNTLVGNQFVRGVSGGERKRVSIMEALASRATINAFDNSTRGLDSSTAVDYIRSLRIMTTLTESTTIVTLYQAGESIYKEFDKVCLIDAGRQIYYGPAQEARAYFEQLGYEAQARSTTADFLTAITNENERRIRKGFEETVPVTPEDLEEAFRSSKYYKQLNAELDAYDQEIKETEAQGAKTFKRAVNDEKAKRTRKKSPYVVNALTQVMNLTQREFQLKWQDKTTLRSKIINAVVVSLMLSSMFFNIPLDSAGAFVTGGACFFSVVIVAWLQFGEGFGMIFSREIVSKQVNYAFYRPSTLLIARMLADIPIMTICVILLNVIVYFMVNFRRSASAFFIHVLFSWTTALVITTWYRACAAWSPNINVFVRVGMVGLNFFAFFGGYMQSRLRMRSWYRWISYISPVAYSQEAVLTNQYAGRILPCAAQQLIPAVPGASIANQVCNIPGSVPGQLMFDPSVYAYVQYGYKRSHLWRNFGILIGFFLFLTVIALAGVEAGQRAINAGLTKQYIRKKRTDISNADDTVLPVVEKENMSQSHSNSDLQKVTTKLNPSVFTFKNVRYEIVGKQLLDNVEGIVKPGVLLALMGASGAGKTTLLDNLAQRKRVGVIQGDLRIDGKELQSNFGRNTGFVEQMDVHDGTSTVREALQLSAILRQPRTTSKKDKLAFVDRVISLLELGPLADALIDGLNIEEKKRVTIAVELAARPDTLLFLDEPTSGLDSNGALSIIRFLRKLARESGLCLICTIHQPSSVLFQNFDEILLLTKGGKTVYFGEIGDEGNKVLEYYARNGAVPAAADANPAEYILETVRPGGAIDWSEVWNASPERKALVEQIETSNQARSAAVRDEGALDDPLTYAMPLYDQTIELTKRVWRNYWRDSSYQYSKVFSNLSMGLIAGILFFQAGNTVIEMQSRAFATFIALITAGSMITSVQPKFLAIRMFYEVRERNSKIYAAPAFIAAMILCEIPYSAFATIFFFLPYYYMVGFPTDSSIAGYQFLFLMTYEIFGSHLGMIVAAIAPSLDIINVINPFIFSTLFSFNGILVPWAQLPGVFKFFVYYINPMAYAARGTIGNVVHGVQVVCAQSEIVTFQPPSGQTCIQYAGGWLSQNFGYLIDENATSGCQYCAYKTGDEFLTSINIRFDHRWDYYGYFTIFLFTNLVLVFTFYALARDIRWGRVWANLWKKKKQA